MNGLVVECGSNESRARVNMALWRWYAPSTDHLFGVFGMLGGLRHAILSTTNPCLSCAKRVDFIEELDSDVEKAL